LQWPHRDGLKWPHFASCVHILCDVGPGLRDEVIRGDLDRGRRALLDVNDELRRQRSAGGQRLQRGAGVVVAEYGGMEAMRVLAELVQRRGKLRWAAAGIREVSESGADRRAIGRS
jgi:hypothetical protein